jgi:hypothetical protein
MQYVLFALDGVTVEHPTDGDPSPFYVGDGSPAAERYEEHLRQGGEVQVHYTAFYVRLDAGLVNLSHREYGPALVRWVEDQLDASGINADPAQAAAMYDALEPVRTPLAAGLVHVALAKLQAGKAALPLDPALLDAIEQDMLIQIQRG